MPFFKPCFKPCSTPCSTPLARSRPVVGAVLFAQVITLIIAIPAGIAGAEGSLLRDLAGGQSPAPSIFAGDDGEPGGSSYKKAPGAGNREWTVQFEPSIWFAAAEGDVDLPGFSLKGSRFADLKIDGTSLHFAGDLVIRRGRWSIILGGFHFEEEGRASPGVGFTLAGESFGDDASLRTDFSQTTILAMAGYRVVAYEGPRLDSGRIGFTGDLDVVAGARFTRLKFDQRATAPGGQSASQSVSELFPQAVLGVRWSMGLIEEFTVDAELTAGWLDTGDRSSLSVEIALGFAWEPTPNFGAQFGYRIIVSSYESGSSDSGFDYEGGLAGLYAGVKLRF